MLAGRISIRCYIHLKYDSPAPGASEGQTDSEMDGKVALETRMDDGEMVASVGVGRVDGLHARIEAEDEIVEVETDAQPVGHGYLTPELIEAELPTGLVGIVAEGPDVAGIDKGGTIDFPEQMGSILDVHVELDVARLVDEVDAPVGTLEGAWAQASDRPPPDAVGPAAEVALLVGQDAAVAVGHGHAQAEVDRERILGREAEALGEVEIDLGVFGIGYVEEGVLPLAVLVGGEEAGEAVEQVSRRFDVEPQAVGIGAVVARGAGEGLGAVAESVAPLHDEEVLVVVPEDGVS